MKAIYKYTILKYFKSYSTWVIMAFSAIVIGFLIGGMLPFIFIDVTKPYAAQTYSKAVVLTVAGITVFFGIFSAIFAGFKSATMFKDEVENGTFLVLISKPMKRIDILIGKWLALQTLLIIYSIVSILFLCAGVTIFDNGSKIPELKLMGIGSLKQSIWYAALFMFVILYLTALIFSSLGIIISTKFSTGTTIGIITAIGVYIPISGLIGMFVRKPEAYPISISAMNLDVADKLLSSELDKNPIVGDLFPDLKQKSEDFFSTQKSTDLYKKAISAEQKDSYSKMYWLDIDYQFKLLSSYTYESLIPKKYFENIKASGTLQNIIQTPEAIRSSGEIGAKTYYDAIQKFVTNFDGLNDEAIQLIIWKMFLELQPANLQDLVKFTTSPEAKGLIKSGSEQTLINNFMNSSIKDDFSLTKLQTLLKDNEQYFVDKNKTIKTFLSWLVTSTTRDDTNFLIKDDYRFKIQKSRLSEMDRLIWKAYEYHVSGTKYPTNGAWPQDVFTELRKHYSSDMVDFLQHMHNEYVDPKNAFTLDDGTVSDDFLYVDFRLLKEKLKLLFIQEIDPSTGKAKYPIRNINSGSILRERFDSKNEVLVDEQYLRARLFETDFNSPLTNQLKKENNIEALEVINPSLESINSFNYALIAFVLRGGIASATYQDVSVQIRPFNEIRKMMEPGYDSVKKYNTQKYSDITEDPMSNLSSPEINSLEFALSAMLDHQGVTYESKPYANRDVVLGIYTAIALGLLPLTYWVVRRQDFR